VLRSNWGDPSHIGFDSVRLFSDKGEVEVFSDEKCWTSAFDEAVPVQVDFEFKTCNVKRLSIINYRSHRSMLNRGVRFVDVFLDEMPVACVEVPKTPLLLTQSQEASIDVQFGSN